MTYQTTVDVAVVAAYLAAITAAQQLLSFYCFSLVAVATVVAVAFSVATMAVVAAYSAATTAAAQQSLSSYFFSLAAVATTVAVTAEETAIADVAVDANSMILHR